MGVNLIMKLDEIRADAKYLYNKIILALELKSNYDKNDLEKLLFYAFHPKKIVWQYCDEYFSLANRIPAVQEQLLYIMHNGKMRDRWIVTISVYPNKVGAELSDKVINLALLDSSAKVRLYGAMRAVSFNYKNYAKLIERAITLEDNPISKESLRLFHRYLVEDFFIEKIGDKKYQVNYYHGFFSFESDIVNEQELRKYVIEHFSHRITP